MREPTTRRTFLAISAAATVTSVAVACGGPEPLPETTPEPTPDPTPAATPIGRGIEFLRGEQSDDGRFQSTTYGFFAEGQSTTPFVALALLAARAPRAAIERAADACLSLRDADTGASGFSAVVPDYPVYSTALTARLLQRVRPPHAGPSEAWLRTQQFRAADGWGDSPATGGFGMGREPPPTPPQPGHVDLSMTRRAVEALAPTDWDGRDEARAFVLRCRSDDGGFVYSPVQPGLNKGAAGPAAGYGTATCDGLLALLALGAAPDDPAVVQAHAFLTSIHRLDANPGLAGGRMDAFGPAMVAYYRAAAARVFRRLGGPDGWDEALRDAVRAGQRDDGSWANPSSLQKEDDPLIATAFALEVLSGRS